MGTCIIPAVTQNTEKSYPISRGTWLYVGGSGPGNYTRIQDAVDNASDGDTVYVYNDSSPYYENIVVNKSVHLIGEDRETTVIDGNWKEHVVFVSSDNASIEGFTIQNSSNDCGGIKLCSNYSTIQRIILRNNYYGILLEDSSYNSIRNNTITMAENTGIMLSFFSRYNLISGNIIHWFNNDGIELIGFSCNNTILENIIEDNLDKGVLIVSDGNILSYNMIRNNNYGISVVHNKNNIIVNNTIRNNLVGVGIQGSTSVNSIIADNTISFCWYGILLNGLKNIVISRNNMLNNTYAIDTTETSNITILKNQFTTNHIGIKIVSSSDTIMYENNINNNIEGIFLENSYKNEIRCNNFNDNTQRNALFSDCNTTVWDSNYWNRPRILPKIIFGKIKLRNIPITWINIDWHPAQEPYDIPGMT